ncbi:MAG: hypothetical protein M3N32_12085 [Actinomycetota bacterium]|nr:hypothetical protein [Actinomycetota bacterium]
MLFATVHLRVGLAGDAGAGEIERPRRREERNTAREKRRTTETAYPYWPAPHPGRSRIKPIHHGGALHAVAW